jgi:hypothetical protein
MLTAAFLVFALSKQVNLTSPHKTNFTVEAGRGLSADPLPGVQIEPLDLPGCKAGTDLAQTFCTKYACNWVALSPPCAGPYCYYDVFGTGCQTGKDDPTAYGDFLTARRCRQDCPSGNCPTEKSFAKCQTLSGSLHTDEKWNGEYLHDDFVVEYLPLSWTNPWVVENTGNTPQCKVTRGREKCELVDLIKNRAPIGTLEQFRFGKAKYAEDVATFAQGLCDSKYKVPQPENSGGKQYRKAGVAGYDFKVELESWSADELVLKKCTDLEGYTQPLVSGGDCAATGGKKPYNQEGWWWVKDVKALKAKGKLSAKVTDFYGTVSGSKEIDGFDSDIIATYNYKGTGLVKAGSPGYRAGTAYSPNPLERLIGPLGSEYSLSQFVEYKNCKVSSSGKNTLSVGGAIGICVAVSVVLCVVTALILYFVCIRAKNPVQSP